MITVRKFDEYDGREVKLYTLSNGELSVDVADLGATVQSIRVKTKKGEQDVCLGYATMQENFASGSYSGGTIGRTCNRIRGAKFTLNGKEYKVSNNEGKNQNHGGKEGFEKRFFTAEVQGEKLVMRLISPDGDQGFPGMLHLQVVFSLDNGLKVEYSGISDQDTLWCPTCHVYFNLDPEYKTVTDHELTIYAQSFTPLDEEHIPTGEVNSVMGTPFDFTSPKTIGQDLHAEDKQLKDANGYDHNFILSGSKAATLSAKSNGLSVTIFTDLPCLQIYTGNFLNGRGKNGEEYGPQSGVALEPQFVPNAINMQGFSAPIIRAGERVEHYVHYIFEK